MKLSIAFAIVSAVGPAAVLAQSGAGNYQQCGGIGWTGATTCATAGWTCQKLNDYYYQCLPGGTTSATSSTRASSTSSSRASSTSTRASSTVQPSSSSRPASSTSSSSSSTPSSTSGVTPEWATAISKAKTYLQRFSLEQKISLGTGVQWMKGHCVGNIAAIPALNFPGICLQDSPTGVRYGDKVSVFPAGINAAATFNRDLMRQRGAALGAEFRGKGVNVALAPAMNLARAPAAGRNWEGFGGDPYLSGEGAYETIKGIQSQGVQACAKHYINNEQEHFRDSPDTTSVVDDRTQHEIYAHPFLKSVQAGVTSVMCSYNKINGTWACENDKVLNDILKREYGFQGYIMSDWWATHSTVPAVNGGLDMTMPGDQTYMSGTTYFGNNLLQAVQNGQVSQARIDDLATRVLAGWYYLGQDSGFPEVNFDSWNINDSFNKHIDVQGDHKNIIRQVGAASAVLLKNIGKALPLNKPKTIGIVGSHAGPPPRGPNACVDRSCNEGVLGMGWGSGTAEYPYIIDPLAAIKTRATTDGTTVSSSLSDTDLTAAASTAAGKDVAIVFITADSGEGYLTVENNMGDRNDLKAWHNGDNLVLAVAKANKNTVVVVNTVGQIIVEPWIEHPNVTAVVWAGLPGQEAGNALVDVLYGAVNPSGRLPYTIAKREEDYSARVLYNIAPTIPYNEKLLIDYRHFDQNNITPRFEFGFGLSYTTFEYSGLSITGSVGSGSAPTGPGSSLDPWLHTPVITVKFTIKNTGTVAGTEIPQLYISPPASANSPPSLLKGFDNVFLTAGQSKEVTISLTRYDLAIWSTTQQKWVIPTGTHGVAIGASSRDKRLNGSITV